jgi:hypothetical protein
MTRMRTSRAAYTATGTMANVTPRRPVQDSTLHALHQAFAVAVATIEAESDAVAALEHANELRSTADEMVTDAASLRAVLALRLMTRDHLSLDGLATRLGISKSRAAQLVNAAKSAERDEPKQPPTASKRSRPPAP